MIPGTATQVVYLHLCLPGYLYRWEWRSVGSGIDFVNSGRVEFLSTSPT